MSKRIEALILKREALKSVLDGYDTTVIERGALTEVEQANYSATDAELTTTLTTLKDISEREARYSDSVQTSSGLGSAAPAAHVNEDAVIYRHGGEFDAINDLVASTNGDPDAASRIYRSNKSNKGLLLRTAATTTDVGGLIVPQYLTADHANIARPGRAFANAIGSRPLTAFTTYIPYATTGAAVGVQATQGTTFTSAVIANSSKTLTAVTIAGVADVAIQAVEFGAVDNASLFQDLVEAYDAKLDYAIFHGLDSAGEWEGIFLSDSMNAITASTADTIGELYAVIQEAAALISSNIYRPATHVVMSSNRWYSLQAAVDLDGRPLLGASYSSPSNVAGSVAGVPIFAGLQVVVDDNIIKAGEYDTNILVTRASELRLFEQNGGTPTTVRLDQAKAADGIVQFIARGYAAFTAERRPKATTWIKALPVPTFNHGS